MSIIGGGFSILLMIGIVAVYVFIMVVLWRFVTAHESIAASLKIIAQNLKKEP